MNQRRILITAALPYANAPLHLGHYVEYSIPDFWSRFQKMRGHDCVYICAADTHGTPIMLGAKAKGITPEELIAGYHKEHHEDLKGFEVDFDHFGSTHTDKNREHAEAFFRTMDEKGLIDTKTLTQFFCEHDRIFLPDRYVVGTCPKCGAEDQYGDSCDVCSGTYLTTEVKDPKCILCRNKPVPRDTDHLFFRLNEFKEDLRAWAPKHTSGEVYNKLKEWLESDLQDWCISRDEPYFGFEIPGHPGKFFYVWLDAPIGYLSSSDQWAEKHGKNLKDYWSEDSELYHSIGKDIIYFHALFWPAMLSAAGWARPKELFVHGLLTVNGVKMSKSKGTFIEAGTYLKHLDATYLRYFYACKINSSIADFDLSFDDFVQRVNSDLIGKITNVASRGATMLHKLDGKLGTCDEGSRHLLDHAKELGDQIAEHFERRDFAKGMLLIRTIADEANKYFDEHEPWKLIKTDIDKTKEVLTTTLNLFRCMAIYLKPILPSYVEKVEKLFGVDPFVWSDAQSLMEHKEINPYEHLVKRIDPKNIEEIVSETKKKYEAMNKPAGKPANEKEKSKKKKTMETSEIEFDDFAQVDLRVAEVREAFDVEGADKLVRLILDVGPEFGSKTVFAGIKSAYTASSLIGRKVVLVNNLKPRKMRFGLSEGMILCAGEGGKDLFLMTPDEGAKPGDKIS